MVQQRNEEQDRQKSFTRRALVLGGAQLLLTGVLVARLQYLQISQAKKYKLLAEDNRINIRLLAPTRGRIVDRFGVPVAVNRQNYQVQLVPEKFGDLDRALDRLGSIVPIDENDRKRIKRDVKRKRSFTPVTVRDNLTWSQVGYIEINKPDLPGVDIVEGLTRDYPYSTSISHVLGYVAAVTERELTGEPVLELPGFRVGKSGVEKLLDKDLRGTAGSSQIEVNALGRTIQELSRDEGRPGNEVVLTMDAGLQLYTHQRLVGERSAAAVILDVATGGVLSLASVPSYDPGPFNVGLSREQWHALTSDPLTPLTNKAISGVYAPGSTFKMIVALAAMKEGIGPSTTAFCPGYLDLGDNRFHCWKRQGHGRTDMNKGIAESCDVYFYELALKVGIDKIAEMAYRLGLGSDTGIDLPNEVAGTIPTKAWKQAAIGERWQIGESLIAAIGQGFVLATPMQLAVMTARLASGRAVTPHVVRGQRAVEGDIVNGVAEAESLGLPPEHLKVIHNAMDDVTNSRKGTAYRYRIEQEDWTMGGKTGTSQVRRITPAERKAGVIKNEDLPWSRRDHGLFVAFAPVDNPRYACAVVVEHGGGSKAAAPIARDLLLEAQRRDPARAEALPLVVADGVTPHNWG
jgi:penicillin-binding protein 2|tara:strand:- start:5927 stop:7819 length:1893 start_codon:yes stop_codon:yes gene_type:complete